MGYFDEDAQEMLEVYLMEAKQLTEQLGAVLLETEKKNAFTGEDIHNIFRIMHTLKSSSAMMGLKGLSSLAHTMEDLFSWFREQQEGIEQAETELFDLLYAFSDYIEDEMKCMVLAGYEPGDTSVLEAGAKDYLKKISSEQVCGEIKEQKSAGEEDDRPREMLEKPGVIVRIRLEEGCRMENIRAFMVVRQITGLCTELETLPANLESAQSEAEQIAEHGVFIRFQSEHKEQVMDILRGGLFVAQCEILKENTAAGKKEPEPAAPAAAASNPENDFLNVRSDRLDRLQNLAREMIIQMMSLEAQLEENGMSDLKEGTAHQINRLISEVERTVMEMHMVPVERIVPKVRRILRDICRDEKKEVDFKASCGDIEADKSVVEYISEALLHLIRNAVDHGIEPPEERIAAGKDPKGKIEFNVESTVGEVLITISDDGRGISQDKILEKSRSMGILSKPEEEYSRQEIMDLLLHPGFTTKDVVTEYSGRGVGLDVVKNVLENAGGNLYIESETGKGSTFTLVVPLTLATMECIRFRVGEYRFSIPARYVFRFLEYGKNRQNIQEINGRNYILFEERMVPLVDLRKFYSLGGETPDTAAIVYAKGTEKEGCLLVDSMYEQKRIVIKQLPALFGVDFRRKTGASGMSIMGSGKICTALDLEILFDLYERGNRWR